MSLHSPLLSSIEMEHLLALGSRICLGSEVGSGCSGGREESGENGLDDRSEDDLGTVGGRESHPENKDELEDVVECYHMSAITVRMAIEEISTYGTSIRR